MKIALGIFKYFPCGGLQADMYNIALEFARRGEDVTVYAGEWNAPEYPEGVKVELLELSGMSNHARALDFARKFHIASAGTDVRFAFNRFGGCDFYFAADDCVKAALKRRAGAFLLRYFGRYRTFLKLEEAIFSPDSRTIIFYISPKQLEEFQAEYGTPADRFVYLGPGVGRDYFLPDAELRQKRRQALGVEDGEIMALFVAANWKLKGGDRVMETFASLPEELKKQHRLHFVGGDAGGEAQKLAQKLDISRYCVFHGPRRDSFAFFQAADVLIHPARKEAAGSVIAEAVACGVPVISSGICGYSSIIRETGAGIVLDEPFAGNDLICAWQKWLEQREDFAGIARSAAENYPLRGRASDAVDVVLNI